MKPEKPYLVDFVRKERNMEFMDELKVLLNKYSAESYSDTPDFILAIYVCKCLEAWNGAVGMRDRFLRGRKLISPLPVRKRKK